MGRAVQLTGVEIAVDPSKLLVTKTDLTGKITYFNDYFRQLSGYSPSALMGAPHAMIRHPDMPRAVFEILWRRIGQDKAEVFAYILNRCANGDAYWALAHVTPSFASDGAVLGYHSNRRAAQPDVVNQVIKPLYAELRAAENAAADRKAGLAAGVQALDAFLERRSVGYGAFSLGLASGRTPPEAFA